MRKAELVSPLHPLDETFGASISCSEDDGSSSEAEEDVSNDQEQDECNPSPKVSGKTKSPAKPKLFRAESLFQTLFYVVNNGDKRAPLPIMLAHTVYEKCKSRELLTTLNHLGYSVSYQTNRRDRNKLAAYTLKKSANDKMPLPSHMNREEFIIAATDNFDHDDKSSLSGTKSNHDTVVVLFQNINPEKPLNRKEKVSDMHPLPTTARTNELLACQRVLPYHYNKTAGKKSPST